MTTTTRITSVMSSSVFVLALDAFALRQFPNVQQGMMQKHASPIRMESDKFLALVNAFVAEHGGTDLLVDGYAPFCKHIFMPNTILSDAMCHAVPITVKNSHLLRSEYSARRPEELPVLVRYFQQGSVELPVAKFLDLILYSKEQVIKENKAMGDDFSAVQSDPSPWRIISIKPQMIDSEIPMQPITMMRNSLGVEEGGSGVPFVRKQYEASVKFWSSHASVI